MMAGSTQAAAVRCYPDPAALARAAADEIAALAAAAIAARGEFHLALSGGATPRRWLGELASRPGAVAWGRVHLWWGDERCVPPDHPDSSYRLAREALLDPLGAAAPPAAQVHRIHGELEPGGAARAYEDELVAALGAPPALDCALQGLGLDGHTASLFPGSPAAAEARRWVMANPVRSPLVPGGAAVRITLTAPALSAARAVRFVVHGADKAGAVAAIVAGPRDPARYPAQRVASADQVWLVDRAAAAQLPHALGGPS
jgi:6-phosphogluconolactonase